MMSRKRRAGLGVTAALLLALGFAGCGGDDGDANQADPAAPLVGSASLIAIGESGVTGSVNLTQDGTRITGVIGVTGLEPGSSHAAHLHGADGARHGCAEDERTSSHLVDFPNIEADKSGVGRLVVNIDGPPNSVREGTYVMVHLNPGSHDQGGGQNEDGDDSRSEGDETSEAQIILVHNGEDHSTDAEAQKHAAGENPPIACGEITGA